MALRFKNILLEDILSKAKKGLTFKDFGEENVFESYVLMAELLNPDDSYTYTEVAKGIWRYQDIFENYIFVRIVYQPVKQPYFEIKTWWVDDETGKKIYNEIPKSSTTQDWDKRSNTIAKIFRDEIIPLFRNQDLTNILKILPVTSSRYYFSLRMVKKFIPADWEIMENSPKEIIIIKK